jgi:hypothetical protein
VTHSRQRAADVCPACNGPMDPILREQGYGYHPGCEPGVRRSRSPAEVKAAAYRIYRAALRRGTLTPADSCEECGAWPEGRQLDGHHDSYAEPLSVRWLCGRCHRAAHRRRSGGQ